MVETAKKRRTGKSTFVGGLEGKLDTAGWILLWLGILLAFVVLCLTPRNFLVYASIVFNGVLLWLLFRSLAEIIRLLKHQAGLPYGGKVSSVTEQVGWECTACGAPLYDPAICVRCGREIVGTEDEF